MKQTLVLSILLGSIVGFSTILQAQTAPSTYSAYTGTDTKTIPPAPALGSANSVIQDPTFGSKILRVTDANTNGGESFVSTDSGFHRSWNADSTAIKLTGPHGDGYWMEFNPNTFKVGDGTSHPVPHPLTFGANWEWSTVDPNIIYFLNGNQIAKYNKATGIRTNLGGPPNGDPVTYSAVVIGQDNWVCAAAGAGAQDTYTELYCVNPTSPGTSEFIDVYNKKINGVLQSDPNWPTSTVGQVIGIHDIAGGTGAKWLEVTFHQQNWGANGGAVLDLGTNTWSLITNGDIYWSGHVSIGNGKYANSAGSIDGRDSRGVLLRDPDNAMNSSQYRFISQPPNTNNAWCDSDHLSWLNSMTNANAPILVSRYMSNAPNCAFAWTGEIYAAAVDGSNTVWRFAHNHDGGCYFGQGFAQISNDGNWALFSSYWDGTLGPDTSFGCQTRIDTFIVQLAGGGSITNVALAANGGVATASSSYNSAYGPSGANNGDRKGLNWGAGGGWNDATPNSWPDWLEVDFNGSKTINEVDVFSVQDNYQSPSDPTATMTFNLYGLTDFQVQYLSGGQWVTVPGGTVSGNNLVWRQLTFSPLTTSAIRVWVTGALGGYSRITEVEAYSTAATGVSVSLSSPTQGMTYTAPATIPVTATATSGNGISKVDFFANGSPIGTANASPYSISWSNVGAGSYTLTAVATDTIGAAATSAPVGITVNTGTGTRTNVALAANGGVATASSSYNSAYGPSGTNDGDRKGLNWGAGGGWNDATANAWPDWLEVDFNGSKTINEVDVFSVQDNYQSPSDPTATMTFNLYGLTNFQVQYWTGSQWLTVPGGAVSGNNLVWRQLTFSPLTTSAIRVWVTGALNGYSRITEIEAYSTAATGVSVSLSSPTQGATYTAPATIPVMATATSSNGISKVDFFANGSLIGTANASPYTISWPNVGAGSYTLTAVATDTIGATATSTPVGITVNTGTGTRTNVALAANGGVATASSSYNSAYGPSGTNDGDRKGLNWGAGGGWNDATGNVWPDWIEVDFNGSKTINEVDVFSVQDNYQSPSNPTATMTFSLYGLTDFQVQYWTGTQWLSVPGAAVSGNNLVWRQLTFGPLTTSAIRIWVTGALAGYSRITEIEAYTQ